MIELKKLNKIYHNEGAEPFHALKDIDLKLPETGMVFVTGPSGGGKTTLLNIIGGLDGFDTGNMLIKGVDSRQLNEKAFDSYRNTYVGFIFQEFNLLDYLTLGENVALAVELQEKKPSKEEIAEVFKKLGMEGLEDRYPNQISGGQKQRVAIARVLIKKPRILFADEASGSVDVATGRIIYQTLKALSKEVLVISVTHSMELAEKYADRIIRIEDGRIVRNDALENSGVEKEAYNGELVYIEPGKKLSVAEIDAINTAIESHGKKGTYIGMTTSASAVEKAFPTAIKEFKKDQAEAKKASKKVVEEPKEDEPFRLIKAKLPMKTTLKLSRTNFVANKFRTSFTIVLTVLAICFFAVSNILTNFNSRNANIKVFMNSNMPYINLYSNDYDGENTMFKDGSLGTESDISLLKTKAKITSSNANFNAMAYVMSLGTGNTENIETRTLNGAYAAYGNKQGVLLNKAIACGYDGEVNDFGQVLLNITEDSSGVPVVNSWPTAPNHVAISDYAAYMLKQNVTFSSPVATLGDLIGQELRLTFLHNAPEKTFIISGIYDANISQYFNINTADETIALKNIADAQLTELDYMIENIYSAMYVTSAFEGNLIGIEVLPSHYAGVNLRDGSSTPVAHTIISRPGMPANTIYYNNGGLTALNIDENNQIALSVVRSIKVGTADMYSIKTQNVYNNLFSAAHEVTVPAGAIWMNEDDFAELAKALVAPNISIAIGAGFSASQYNNMAKAIENTELVSFDSVHINEFAERFSVVGNGFLTASIVLAIFAIVLLYNFVAQSIRSKRRNIGILRAIGAGMRDVIKIFMLEAAMLAAIITASSIALTALTTLILNGIIQTSVSYGLTVFAFSGATIGIMTAISVLVTFASYIIPLMPLYKVKPIEIIQKKNLQ